MANTELLRPAILTDAETGLPYVDIVDELGFAAGYEPTQPQIVAAVTASLGITERSHIRNTVELPLFGLRVAELTLNTATVQGMFVPVGEDEIFSHAVDKKNAESVALAAVVQYKDRQAWRDVRRTTETVEFTQINDLDQTATIISEGEK